MLPSAFILVQSLWEPQSCYQTTGVNLLFQVNVVSKELKQFPLPDQEQSAHTLVWDQLSRE